MAAEEEKKRNINLPIGESELNCQEQTKVKWVDFLLLLLLLSLHILVTISGSSSFECHSKLDE